MGSLHSQIIETKAMGSAAMGVACTATPRVLSEDIREVKLLPDSSSCWSTSLLFERDEDEAHVASTKSSTDLSLPGALPCRTWAKISKFGLRVKMD